MLLMTVATTALPREPPFRLHLLGAHEHHVIAVEHPAGRVDENRAIAVAVERDAQPVAALSDDRRQACPDASIRRPC